MSTEQPPLDEPGFNLYADQRGRIIGSCAAMLSLTIIFVFLRLLSRKLSRAGYWWDDLFTVLALVFSNVCCILSLIEISEGFGRHVYIFDPADRVKKTRGWLRDLFIFELFFHIATTLSKVAVLTFYYRIFPILHFRRMFIGVGFLSLLYLVSIEFAVIFQCQPIHYAWDRVNPNFHGHCFDVDAFFIGSGSVNVALNLVIFALPIPLLWRLRTTRNQQIVLTALFILAGFVVVVSIVWVIVLSRLEQTDVTWNYVNAGIWSTLEPNMAVICACIPSLRPLANVTGQRFADAPLLKRQNLHQYHSTGSGSSPSRIRMWEKSTKSGNSSLRPGGGGGAFSQLDEQPDDLRPLGHDVSVQGGIAGGEEQGHSREEIDGENMELPRQGISVRTEVILSTSERLYYNDRLF